MAEQLTSIALQAFRGVADRFEICLPKGRSLVVLGPNGTGKSTIADALEWYFTRRIDALRREGCDGGRRHVGASLDLETAVEVRTTGVLGGRATEEVPARSEVTAVGTREVFLLRGRTLAAFVDKRKGEKWKELAEILGLAEAEQLHRDLNTCRNQLRGAREDAELALATAARVLQDHGAQPTAGGIVAVVRAHCMAVGIQAPESLEEILDPRWCPASNSSDERGRAAVLGDLVSHLRALEVGAGALDPSSAVQWNSSLDTAPSSPARLQLHRAAQALLEEEGQATSCPLCRQAVEPETFGELIAQTLSGLREASGRLERAQGEINVFISRLRATSRERAELRRHAAGATVDLDPPPPCPANSVEDAVSGGRAIDLGVITGYQEAVAAWDATVLRALEEATPTTTNSRDEALIELGRLAGQIRRWDEAARHQRRAVAAHAVADRVASAYERGLAAHVDRVLAEINDRVASIYARLRPEDGPVNVATKGSKGIEFTVDFHGRKQSPPQRVLSESRLNSLAIAMFLAMAGTFNEHLGFLVLDDVVNSFDTEHRGRLAEVLTDGLGDTQIIVLTHDKEFFSRIGLRAPSWERLELFGWGFEGGPRTRRTEADRELCEAREHLARGELEAAARSGRVALEGLLLEACERLQAPLPFRRGHANEHRTLGEMLSGLRRCLEKNATSYLKAIDGQLKDLDADIQAALNTASHAGEGTVSTQEVRDALDRVEGLRQHWTCQGCGTRIWYKGSSQAGSCRCGTSHFPPPALSEATAAPPAGAIH